ncbi:Alpha/Beta hydrolase protein [Clohesyomyces aquaticus]|uniref:Alpha/Beta hydrolase protein n=1 Tax=Clohesyomyces aquaticus TaxID=1231657 RepID=A0A1Y1ZE24_9PLEO|nr:Alpha/Beta hydrolase protein [Clohesyomyces aquaticus]
MSGSKKNATPATASSSKGKAPSSTASSLAGKEALKLVNLNEHKVMNVVGETNLYKKDWTDPEIIAGKTKWNPFEVITTHFAEINGEKLEVVILIPKGLEKTKNIPVHVKFHGGGFTTGSASFRPWFQQHLVDLAVEAGAVTFIPNYRLMPEANGEQLLSDVKSFWDWYLDGSAQAAVQGQATFDIELLLVSGESAGGFLAVYSWFILKPTLKVNVLYLQYPMLRKYQRDFGKQKTGKCLGENVDLSKVDWTVETCLDEIEKIRAAGKIPQSTGADFPQRLGITFALSASKRWGEAFAQPDILDMVPDVNPDLITFPRIYVFHGLEDENCPAKDTKEFVDVIRQKWWGENMKRDTLKEAKEWVVYTEVERQAHGFDKLIRATDAEWLKDMNGGVCKHWLEPASLPKRLIA